jgi:hypothetical protein
MKSETWTTELGNKVELNWEVKSNDLNVWTVITVTAKGKVYTSDGEIDNGKLVVKDCGIKSLRLTVPSEILEKISEARKSAKASIADSVEEHNNYLRRMAQLGY